MSFENKAVLITGGSRGLGAALARSLVRRGARVALIARGKEELDAVVSELRSGGHEAHGIAADIADKRSVHAIAATAAQLVGPIDILIHNASSLGPVPLRPLLETDCEELEAVLETNLVGPFRLTKIVAGRMALRGGLIVHITSDAATSAYPNWGAYGVSKAALEHLGRIWAAELEQSGIRFLNVDPGEMDTRMHADAIPEADPEALTKPSDAAEAIVALLQDPTATSGARVEVRP